MIEAIIYTLTDLDDINGVELYINGELLKYIPHTNKNLPTILTKDYGINKKYEISSNKDINKVKKDKEEISKDVDIIYQLTNHFICIVPLHLCIFYFFQR